MWLPLICGSEPAAGEINIRVRVLGLDKLHTAVPRAFPLTDIVSSDELDKDVLAPSLGAREMVLHRIPQVLGMVHLGTGGVDCVGTLVVTTHRLLFVEATGVGSPADVATLDLADCVSYSVRSMWWPHTACMCWHVCACVCMCLQGIASVYACARVSVVVGAGACTHWQHCVQIPVAAVRAVRTSRREHAMFAAPGVSVPVLEVVSQDSLTSQFLMCPLANTAAVTTGLCRDAAFGLVARDLVWLIAQGGFTLPAGYIADKAGLPAPPVFSMAAECVEGGVWCNGSGSIPHLWLCVYVRVGEQVPPSRRTGRSELACHRCQRAVHAVRNVPGMYCHSSR